MIDESEKNDDTRKISAISKKLQPLGLYTPFKDISELKDNVSKILQAEVMNLIRKQGQVMPEIHKYIEISDTNEFISNFSSNNKLYKIKVIMICWILKGKIQIIFLKKKYLTEINLWYPTYQMLLLWGIIRHCLLIRDMQM